MEIDKFMKGSDILSTLLNRFESIKAVVSSNSQDIQKLECIYVSDSTTGYKN